MKEYDFILVYAYKARELENILLLKNELVRRGYSVKVEPFWKEGRPFSQNRAKVVVFQASNTAALECFSYHAKDLHRALLLKWEQIFSVERSKRRDIYQAISGKAAETVSVAWGEKTYRRFIDLYGVPENNVRLTGHMSHDFLRDEFRSYFFSKEELCKKYGIDPSSDLYLYISSFTFNSITEEELKSWRYLGSGHDVDSMKKLQTYSQTETLRWIREALRKHPDTHFIYRPHPAELSNKELLKFDREHPNFHVITDYSVKQWIIVCDKIYTWYSTSIGEIFAAHKPCRVIRPYPIPTDMDVECYQNARIISDYEEFEKDFSYVGTFEDDFPVPIEQMKSYYYIPDDTYTFRLVADACEDVYRKDEYYIEDFPHVKKENVLKTAVKYAEREFLGRSRLCHALSKKILKGTRFSRSVGINRDKAGKAKKHTASRKEIRETERRIEKMLENSKFD